MKYRKIIEAITGKMKNKQTVLIILIIGVIIMLTAGAFSPNDEEKVSDNNSISYCRSLEEKLTEILSEMKGVGKVRVMITAENEKNSGGSFFGNENNNETVNIKGVVIAAQGAADQAVNEKIYYAAKAALNIGGSRIAVVESK